MSDYATYRASESLHDVNSELNRLKREVSNGKGWVAL